jgi:hypothetical protein
VPRRQPYLCGIYAAAFGCFDLLPPAGMAVTGRNFASGPPAVNIGLRIAHTWAFGGEGQRGVSQAAGHGGPIGNGSLAGMFDTPMGKRYNVTISAFTLNALNHANFAPPEGDLSSPYFGQPLGVGGLIVMAHGGTTGTYNRKIDLQVRFKF